MNESGYATRQLAEALVTLGRTGATLRLLSETAVEIRSPRAVQPEARQVIETLQEEVAALLASESNTLALLSVEAREVFIERIGIAMDQELSAKPGSPAWLTAAGEALQHDADEAALSHPLAPARTGSHNDDTRKAG